MESKQLQAIVVHLKKRYTYYLIGMGVLIFVVLPVGLYFYSPLGTLTYRCFRYLPYPVAKVEGAGFITSSQMIADTEAVKQFYQSQDFSQIGMRVDFTTDEGKNRLKIKEKEVLEKLIENRVIKRLAQKRGISVTAKEAQQAIDQQVAIAGDALKLASNLRSLYGWNMDQFRDNVVIPQRYLTKLSDYYYTNEQQNDSGYKEITAAKAALKTDGSNFAEVVAQYSEGDSAKNGGELGWFRIEQLVPEVADAVQQLQPKTISGVISSSLGYHIVEVQEVRELSQEEQQTDNQDQNNTEAAKEYRVRQIFVRSGGFIDWLSEQKKNTTVLMLMHTYRWDASQGRVFFRDERMNQIEETLRNKSEGDPSMQ